MRQGIGVWMFALGVVGCGGGAQGASSGEGNGAGGENPPSSSQYAGPIGSTDTAHGEERYNARCNGCHSEGSGGPTLANIGWTAERMRQQIREGSGQMPAISENRLSNEDMEAVLAYLVTIGAISEGGAATAE